MKASSTSVSICICARSRAMTKSVGVCRLAATVCPTSTSREMTTPSMGAWIFVWARFTRASSSAARRWPRAASAAFCSIWAPSRAKRMESSSLSDATRSSWSLRRRSSWRCLSRTATSVLPRAASALRRLASAWATSASKREGSISAIKSSLRTRLLKSAWSRWIRPETWLPTWTVIRGLSAPVADTLATISPRSIVATAYPGRGEVASPPR